MDPRPSSIIAQVIPAAAMMSEAANATRPRKAAPVMVASFMEHVPREAPRGHSRTAPAADGLFRHADSAAGASRNPAADESPDGRSASLGTAELVNRFPSQGNCSGSVFPRALA